MLKVLFYSFLSSTVINYLHCSEPEELICELSDRVNVPIWISTNLSDKFPMYSNNFEKIDDFSNGNNILSLSKNLPPVLDYRWQTSKSENPYTVNKICRTINLSVRLENYAKICVILKDSRQCGFIYGHINEKVKLTDKLDINFHENKFTKRDVKPWLHYSLYQDEDNNLFIELNKTNIFETGTSQFYVKNVTLSSNNFYLRKSKVKFQEYKLKEIRNSTEIGKPININNADSLIVMMALMCRKCKLKFNDDFIPLKNEIGNNQWQEIVLKPKFLNKDLHLKIGPTITDSSTFYYIDDVVIMNKNYKPKISNSNVSTSSAYCQNLRDSIIAESKISSMPNSITKENNIDPNIVCGANKNCNNRIIYWYSIYKYNDSVTNNVLQSKNKINYKPALLGLNVHQQGNMFYIPQRALRNHSNANKNITNNNNNNKNLETTSFISVPNRFNLDDKKENTLDELSTATTTDNETFLPDDDSTTLMTVTEDSTHKDTQVFSEDKLTTENINLNGEENTKTDESTMLQIDNNFIESTSDYTTTISNNEITTTQIDTDTTPIEIIYNYEYSSEIKVSISTDICNKDTCMVKIVHSLKNVNDKQLYLIAFDKLNHMNKTNEAIWEEESYLFKLLEQKEPARGERYFIKIQSLANKRFTVNVAKNLNAMFTELGNKQFEIVAILQSKKKYYKFENEPETNKASYNKYLLLLLIPILLGILFIIIINVNRRKKKVIQTNNIEEEHPLAFDAISKDDDNVELRNKMFGKRTFGFQPLTINKEDFVDTLKEIIQKGMHEIEYEFDECPIATLMPTNIGSRPDNKIKNRYQNILPYDVTRVKLDNDVYINASYISGHKGVKTYIATQCPKPITCNDFWKMIWEQNVSLIVCLVTFTQEDKDVTFKYWPDFEMESNYGDIYVSHLSQTHYTDFIIHKLVATRSENSRNISIVQYLTWPDKSIPIFPLSLLRCVKEVQKLDQSESPIVCHCSAGIGRTGVFVILDSILRDNESDLTITNYLKEARRCRQLLVSNHKQYRLLYYLYCEHLLSVNSSMTLDEFLNKSNDDIIKLSESNMLLSNERLQFEKLVHDQDLPHVYCPENSRNPNVEPRGSGVVQLSQYPSSDVTSSYINAVIVHGYECINKFITTQYPTGRTLCNFWRLVYNQNVTTILALQNLSEQQNEDRFWPHEGGILTPVNYLKVKYSTKYTDDLCNIVNIQLTNTNTEVQRTVKIIFYNKWEKDEMTPNSLEHFYKFYKLTKNYKPKILLCCYDAAHACGLYMCYHLLQNMLKTENIVDMQWAVRGIRNRRQEFMNHQQQFEFAFNLLKYHLEHADDETPFDNLYHQDSDYENV